MKKLKNLLVTLALCAPLTGTAQDIEINAQNFPDKNFRAYLLEQDYGADGVITKAEIEEITYIYVFGRNISNLKGIEHFTALTELDCYSNQLTSLDVSNNTALAELECGWNQLTALDVSSNTALTELECHGNQLTSLDVSNNTALTKLWCGDNLLTTLDVSNNMALTDLYCSCDQLMTLDVSNNIALTKLTCEGTQLTELDVSQNTALKELCCGWNLFTSIDVSNNTALEWLYCDGLHLTSLDVSNNTALTRLYCHSNQIKGKAMDALINSLPDITEILPKNQSVYDEGAIGLLVVCYDGVDDDNVCTKQQVATAKAKGWTPCYVFRGHWEEYEGCDESAGITLPQLTNGTLPSYTLDGHKVTTPQKGGIYIVGGKKVIVK